MTRLKCKLVSVYLELVLILTQDRCMVCVEPMVRSTQTMHLSCVKIRCMVCVERTIGSEIVSDAPDGTPR